MHAPYDVSGSQSSTYYDADDTLVTATRKVVTQTYPRSTEMRNASARKVFKAPTTLTGYPEGSLTAYCAEPGMGKTAYVSQLVRMANDEKRPCYVFEFKDDLSKVACKRIVRTCRELTRRTTPEERADARPLVLFDGITPPEEHEVVSEARAIERLVAAGFQVAVFVRPESEQLVEALDDCRVNYADDLLMRCSDHDTTAWGYTGGIPVLVQALIEDESIDSGRAVGPKYLASLRSLIERTLRHELCLEELRLRLAMMLLGAGTLDDLLHVAGRCDAESMVWLARDVPLVGVNVQAQTFCCHGLSDDGILCECLSALQSSASVWPDMVVRTCGLLSARGDVRRSALVCALCSSERDLVTIGTTWGVAYVAVGEGALVDEALRLSREKGREADVFTAASEAALMSTVGSTQQLDAARQRIDTLTLSTPAEKRAYASALLLCACRDVWRHPHQTLGWLGVSVRDAQGLAAQQHLRIARLLASGRFSEAYGTISNDLMVREVCDLPTALLCDDLYLSLVLSGGVPDARERYLFESARSFYARAKMGRAQAYHMAFEQLPCVLMGHLADTAMLEDVLVRAGRAGDTFLQAVFLLALATADVRARALSRAHVRAEKATTLAHALGEDYLQASASLVDALVLEEMGETGSIAAWRAQEGRPEVLALVAKVVAHAMGEMADWELGPVQLGMACPRDALWLLALVALDCQATSRQVLGSMPATWIDVVRAARNRQVAAGFLEADARPAEAAKPPETEPQFVHPVILPPTPTLTAVPHPLDEGDQTQLLPVAQADERVHISILGGFYAEVDGRAVAEKLFDRRRARDLVSLLAIAPGHRLRRYQAIEILWPGVDYVRGPRKLYEATSEARKQLGMSLDGHNPLIADRSQGSISFNMAVVSCDVDEFEHEARMTLAEDGDDFWVLDHARRMERLYSTGPDPHLLSLGVQVIERLEELKTLYVDAAMAAGEAALRLGKAKLAVRYATDAHQLRDLREDVMVLLVQALRAAGRGYEVEGLYRRYVKRRMKEQGTPPSLVLQHVVSVASEGGQRALTA